jgi:hypothetical protein
MIALIGLAHDRTVAILCSAANRFRALADADTSLGPEAPDEEAVG